MPPMHTRKTSVLSPRRFSGVLLALTIAATPLAAETIDSIQRTLPAAPGGSLVVRPRGVTVEVRAGAADTVAIDIERKVSMSSKSDEERFLARRPITIEESDGTITIRETGDRERLGWSWFGGGRISGRFVITAPPRFSANLDTSGGDIRVEGLTGEGATASCTNVRGTINGGGPLVRASTRGGGIHIKRTDS